MKKMSVILAILLVLAMLLGACAQATPEPVEEAAAKPFRVAVIMPSKINDCFQPEHVRRLDGRTEGNGG